MQITAAAVKDLTPAQWQAWRDIQQTQPELASPHFHPELVRCLSDFREGLEVAILQQHGRIMGFFPYHRSRTNVGEPVASSFSELQGLVASADLEFSVRDMLRACGLRRVAFTEVLATQTAFQPYHLVSGACPYLDLSNGFDNYWQARREAGSDVLHQTLRKLRKVQREVGPVRVELCNHDSDVLETLIRWKESQLLERKLVNPFQVSWVRPFLRRLLEYRGDGFGGMLSLLYIGDHLSAATLGVRSGHVLNCWVNAYDLKYQAFSPGLLLLTKLAQELHALGVTRVDLGRGPESYKKSFASSAIPVAEASIDGSFFANLVRSTSVQAREWVRATPLGQPARRVVQRCRYALAQWKTMLPPPGLND